MSKSLQSHRREPRSAERGQVIVLVVVALVVLFAIAGLASDIGMIWRSKLQMQSVADAAAIAGTDALFNGAGISASNAAQAAATQNGFTNGSGTTTNSNTVTVTVNHPPLSGPNAGNSNAVEVIISQVQPTYLLAAAGFSSMNVAARSVAIEISSKNCMYTLSPSASGALLLNSNAAITSACGIVVNSNSGTAVITNSNSSITAPSLGIVGGDNGGGGLPSNTSTGVAATSDPLAYVPTPSTSGSCTSVSPVNSNSTLNLGVGYYCGLTANSNSTVNLTGSGTYSFNGNVVINSNSSLNGTGGVTLYFKSGSLTLNSNSTLDLVAPTTGTYAGIVIFQDRADSTSMILNSNSAMTLTGAVYAADANVTLNSNSFSNVYSILVASTITINSNAAINMNANYSSLPNGSPIKMAATVE
jgi:Putative Tad-like Flp pilus-assembly